MHSNSGELRFQVLARRGLSRVPVIFYNVEQRLSAGTLHQMADRMPNEQ